MCNENKETQNSIPGSISNMSSGSLSLGGATVIRLYRPLTPAQLACVIRSGWKRFSLEEHKNEYNFYVKLSRKYAEMVARQWNAPQYSAGYVAQFDLPVEFIRNYEMESVAYDDHLEYCVPITDLAALNRKIIGDISIVAAFPAIHQHQKQAALMFE